MAHRQKYLAGGYPVITLEEAYWKVMSTITKVNDLTRTCTEDGITTLKQRLEAENLRHILVDQNTRLYDIWRNEKNVEKLYNTRELVQIIDEEVVEKLATLKNTIISLPGTTPNPRPSSLSPPRYPPRQHYRQENPEHHYTNEHSTAGKIRRTMVYAYQQYHPDETHLNITTSRPCNANWTQAPEETDTYRHDKTTPPRKRSYQATADNEPNPKVRRTHNYTDERQRTANTTHMVPTERKNTADMDAMIPPDIKPTVNLDAALDVKPDIKSDAKNPKCSNTEADNFVTHVAKHSKRILIEEYQPTRTRGGPKPIEAPNTAFPTPHRKYRTKQTKDDKPTTNVTTATQEPIGKIRHSKVKPILDNVTQTVNEDNIEHRKRKHNIGTNQNLARWLWEDPQRLPKVQQDVTRWSEYMATEISNPAFELFINMAANLSNTKEHTSEA